MWALMDDGVGEELMFVLFNPHLCIKTERTERDGEREKRGNLCFVLFGSVFNWFQYLVTSHSPIPSHEAKRSKAS